MLRAGRQPRVRRLRGDRAAEIVEQAAVAGALTLEPERALAAAQVPGGAAGCAGAAERAGLEGARPMPMRLILPRIVRGVTERHALNPAALRSAEARWLDERRDDPGQDSGGDAELLLDGTSATVQGRRWPSIASWRRGGRA